jgi:serine/threonine protein phosphatase PrpC
MWGQSRRAVTRLLVTRGRQHMGGLYYAAAAAGGTTTLCAVTAVASCEEEKKKFGTSRRVTTFEGHGGKEMDAAELARHLGTGQEGTTVTKTNSSGSTTRGSGGRGLKRMMTQKAPEILVEEPKGGLFDMLKSKGNMIKVPDDPTLLPAAKVGSFSCHGQDSHQFVVRSGMGGDKKIVTVVSEKTNQDRGNVSYPFNGDKRSALFATYDGHGTRGELVAEYCMNNIPERLQRHPQYDTHLAKAITDVIQTIDQEICHMDDMEPFTSGCTACIVLMQGDQLFMFNVGDSRAVMGTCPGGRKGKKVVVAEDLTDDQNATVDEERKRIIATGGFISEPERPGLPSRVWLDEKCTKIGLGVSRSIGDFALKKSGVIPDPVVTNRTLSPNDEFMIVASDGVWGFIESEEAVQIVQDGFNEGNNASEACMRLIKKAMERWKEHEGEAYRDDITAIVVRVNELWVDE